MKKLHLLNDPFNVKNLAKMYEAMTGRRPTPAEMAEAKAVLTKTHISHPAKNEVK